MEKLPREIAREIFYRLPPKSVVQCKLVCKSWRSLIARGDDDDANYFANMNLQRYQQHTLDLNFIALHEFVQEQKGWICAVGQLHLTELDYDDDAAAEDMKLHYKLQVKRINYPQICRNAAGWIKIIRTRLVGSCNGLVCLQSKMFNDSKRTGIWNPLLNEYVRLPVSDLQRKIENGEDYTTKFAGFGYHPITDEYKVVRISYRLKDIGEVEVYTLGKSNGMWRHIGSIEYMLRHGLRPALVNGSLHWLSSQMPLQIVSFDLKVEEFYVTPVLLPHSPSGMLTMELKELKGCLSFVCSREEEMEIWVLKDYMNKESWVKEFSISITREESTCHYSPCAIMKNKNGGHDQLLLWWKNREKFVSYDLKSQTVEDVEGGKQVDHVIESSPSRQLLVRCPVLHINSLISLKALGEDPNLYRKSSGNINMGAWKRRKILQRIILKAKVASKQRKKEKGDILRQWHVDIENVLSSL